MLSNVTLPCFTAATIVEKLLFKRTKSDASLVTSLPVPIAIPMSAIFTAGASFTPSPVIATTSSRF